MADPTAKARAVLDGVYRGLQRPDDLAELTARELLSAAQAKARSRPTPQAPMVAAGFAVDADVIRGPRSGTLAELTMGAEFGSTMYRQFGSRHGGGAWLFPTLATPPASVEQEQYRWLDELLNG